MAAKEKKYKYIEDVMEDYIRLQDEQIEIPLIVEKLKKKHEALFADLTDKAVKKNEAEDLFKIFCQTKKCTERKEEIKEEMAEVEDVLKQFLISINGKQLAYEKKDDVEKMKITYLFWLEDGVLKCNR